MARRKRLILTPFDGQSEGQPDAAPEGPFKTTPDDAPDPFNTLTMRMPPIAQVAGDAAAQAALAELATEMAQARSQGRLVQSLPLDAVDEGWLHRDRIAVDADDMADLVASIRDRGQQAPVEVVALDGGRYGLISGWRRLMALRSLHAETGDARFSSVQALLRRPETSADAYRAMVEENEIRAALTYYERARIAALAAGAGAYPDPRAAVTALFAAGSRAKRSKIGSFLVLYQALDKWLRFGRAIPERLGLQLARVLDADPAFAARLRDRLRKAAPDTAEAELALLERALRPERGQERGPERGSERGPDQGAEPPILTETDPVPARRDPVSAAADPGEAPETVRVESAPDGSLRLSGPGVDAGFKARLTAWLRGEQ